MTTAKTLSALLIVTVMVAAGCGQAAKTPAPNGQVASNGAHAVEPAAPHDDASGHDHGGWWCPEHGMPEEICAQCNSKLAAEFQKKGDWCKEHDRPDSQCFLCHPELEAKFAAQYEARYGKKPPKPQL